MPDESSENAKKAPKIAGCFGIYRDNFGLKRFVTRALDFSGRK